MKTSKIIFTISFLTLAIFGGIILISKTAFADGCSDRGGTCQPISAPCSTGYVKNICANTPENVQCCISGGGGGSGSGLTGSKPTGAKSGGTQLISLPNPLGAVKTIPELIGRIVDWLILIASIAVLPFMIVWGAYQLLTAGGNPDAVTSARHTITWAVVGYALLLISKGIEFIIRDILTRGA